MIPCSPKTGDLDSLSKIKKKTGEANAINIAKVLKGRKFPGLQTGSRTRRERESLLIQESDRESPGRPSIDELESPSTTNFKRVCLQWMISDYIEVQSLIV